MKHITKQADPNSAINDQDIPCQENPDNNLVNTAPIQSSSSNDEGSTETQTTEADSVISHDTQHQQSQNLSGHLKSAKQSLENIAAHPYRTRLASMVPFRKRPIVEQIAAQLCLMGRDTNVSELCNLLPLSSDNTVSGEQILEDFLQQLYVLFDEISSCVEYCDQISLKRLKKLIHQFAEEIGLSKRLYNLNKLAKRISENNDSQLAAILAEKRGDWGSRRYRYIEVDIDPIMSPEQKSKRRKLKKYLNWVCL